MENKKILISIIKHKREPNNVLYEIISNTELSNKSCDTLKKIAASIITKKLTQSYKINREIEYVFNFELNEFEESDIKKFKLYLIQECILYYKYNTIGFFEIE